MIQKVSLKKSPKRNLHHHGWFNMYFIAIYYCLWAKPVILHYNKMKYKVILFCLILTINLKKYSKVTFEFYSKENASKNFLWVKYVEN